jgi:inner membrane protein involved in colicin E2 resistance
MACGFLFFALAHVLGRILNDGWHLLTGLMGIGVAVVIAVLLHSTNQSWRKSVGRTVGVVVMMAISVWCLRQDDGWLGFVVLLGTALVFGVIVRGVRKHEV